MSPLLTVPENKPSRPGWHAVLVEDETRGVFYTTEARWDDGVWLTKQPGERVVAFEDQT